MPSNIFADSATPEAFSADQDNPRRDGIRTDDGYFIVTDADEHIVPDGPPNASPYEITNTILATSVPPAEWRGTMLRDMPTPMDHISPLTVDASHDMPLEIMNIATSNSIAPVNFIAAIAILQAINMDTIGNFFIDSPSRFEIVNMAATMWFSVVELTNNIIPLFPVPMELHGPLQSDTASLVEMSGIERVDSKTPFEIVNDFHGLLSFVPSDHNSMLRQDAPVVVEHLTAMLKDSPGRVEFLTTLISNVALALEEIGKRAQTYVAITDHLGSVIDASSLPFAVTGMLLHDTPFPVEYKGGSFISTAHDQLLEINVQVTVDNHLVKETLAGLKYDHTGRLEWRGVMRQDTPVLEESGVRIVGDKPAPLEKTAGIRTDEKVPAGNNSGIILSDRSAVLEFRTGLRRDSGVVLEAVTALRHDSPAAPEHLVAVAGLTITRAAYSGTLLGSGAIPAAYGTALAESTAALVERLAGQHGADMVARPEWRGAFVVDTPIRNEHQTKLLSSDFPAVVEITMRVTRDSGIPLNFHGYAFIRNAALIGTQEEITLIGTNAQILLVGGVGG